MVCKHALACPPAPWCAGCSRDLHYAARPRSAVDSTGGGPDAGQRPRHAPPHLRVVVHDL